MLSIPQLRPMALVMTAAALALAALVGADELPDRATFYLQDIRGAVERLESVAPRHLDGDALTPPRPDLYQINMSSGELISLRRNFSRSIIDRAAVPLGVLYQEDMVTEAGLNFGSSTALSFSSTTTNLKDVRGLSLDTRRVDIMGLRQGFGQGEGASTLAFTRTVTDQTVQGASSNTSVDVLDFHSGLSKTSDLALRASRLTTDVPQGLQETDLQGVLKLTFSGGESPFSYLRNHKFNDALDILTEKMDFAIPLAMYGQKALAEYHTAFTTTNGVEVGQRTTHLLVPLRFDGQMGSFDHLILGVNQGAGMVETTTSKLVTPFSIGKRNFSTEGTHITLEQAGVTTDTLLAKLTAPLAGGQATVQRQTIKTETTAGTTEVEQLALTLPAIKLNKALSVTGQRVSTETVGVMNQDLTNLSLTADPLKPLHIEAQYQINDSSAAETTTSRQLHTKWAINDKMSLLGRFSEAEVLGTTPNVLRLVELVRDRGASDIGLRAGLASYEVPGAEMENARRVEISAGKSQTVALTAAYSEYDPNTFARLPADATVAVALQHGDPADFAVRWRYEDQPTRIEPLQAVDVAMKALGGTLQVGYQSNPVAPDGQTVRQAEQYEATLGRKIFGGGVNLELGYRYLAYDETEGVDRHVRIKLDGGKEEDGGKIALAYFTGDFTPPSTTAGIPTPGSLLDVTYSRTWGDTGRLSLSLKRQTAPTQTIGEENTEGRVEYSRVF